MGGGITKLNSNAFTLIELLAIIVILAIIAVITVPIILNIIENSRKGAATDSAYGYKDSVNKTYIAELQNHNKLKLDGTYTVKSDGSLEPTEDNTFGFGDSEYGDSLDVQVSGTIPSGGKLRYSNNVLNAGCVVIGDYKVTFGTDGKVDGTVKGDCASYEFDDGNYLYSDLYAFDWQEEKSDWHDVYFRKNILTSKEELCSDSISDKTLCISCESYDSTTNACVNSTSYILSKKTEFETMGLSCIYESDEYGQFLSCDYPDSENYFIIQSNYLLMTSPKIYSCQYELKARAWEFEENDASSNGCS